MAAGDAGHGGLGRLGRVGQPAGLKPGGGGHALGGGQRAEGLALSLARHTSAAPVSAAAHQPSKL
jgi:hypothetical protein